MKKLLFTALCALALTGCKSTVPGRIVGVEWDSRGPEQITAMEATDAAVYGGTGKDKAAPEARSFTAWGEMFKMITALRVRLRVATIEWGSEKK